jgi:hypothetical protein
MREEGKVILRVLVTPEGNADSLESTLRPAARGSTNPPCARFANGSSFRRGAAIRPCKAGSWFPSSSSWSDCKTWLGHRVGETMLILQTNVDGLSDTFIALGLHYPHSQEDNGFKWTAVKRSAFQPTGKSP